MIIPSQYVLGWSSGQAPLTEPQGDTGSELTREWANPSVAVATVLMFVGGNVVQEALSQLTGKAFTPVAFSFGWPAYALSSLKGVLGEGRLLPTPDYPVKVFNLMSSYYRVNKNWIIGRIVRDHEAWISEAESSNNIGIRIAIFEATSPGDDGGDEKKHPGFRYTSIHLLGAVVIVLQLIIAAIPTIRTNGHEWGILAITAFGTFLSLLMGSLPQWVAEKMPNTRQSNKVFALTAGNGSRDVMIIKGEGRCPDLECLATLDSPITASPWTTMDRFSLSRKNSLSRDAKMIFGRPLGFQITRCMCIFQTLGWLFILISLAGIRSHTWCLIAVGAIGLIHNSMLADLRRTPKARNLPLKLLDTITTRKIMDGLMDLEMTHTGCGEPLLQEFFPGRLREEEKKWWDSAEHERSDTEYDKTRLKEYLRRGRPRSMLPRYNLHATPSTTDAHKPQHASPLASITSVATAAVTSMEPSTVTPEPTRTESGVGGGSRIASPVRHQRPPRSPQDQIRKTSSPPMSPRLYHADHRSQYHHQPRIGASDPSPTVIRDRPSSPSMYDNLGRQAHWAPWPAGTRNDIDIDNSHRPERGRNSPISRVSNPTSPIRHQQRVTTPLSRRSTLSPPGADPGAAGGGMTREQRAALWEESEEEEDYTASPEYAANLRYGGEQSESAARHISVGAVSSTHAHGVGNDGDADGTNSEPPSLVDITEEMPKRPFWD